MLRLATLFSGIGAIEQALIQLNIDHEIVFACDNGERELSIPRESIEKEIKNMTHEEKKEYIDKLYLSTNKENRSQCGL